VQHNLAMQITPRQSFVLRKVVEGHVQGGTPVASKWLAERDDVPWGPSTIRAEFARLEELGLLHQPHTSAGRVPTDYGYRHYVDALLLEGGLPVPRPRLAPGAIRRQLDEAMRATSEQLSQVNNLLAIVSAPPIATTTIRRIEVLLLQPQVAMVVVITSTGGVSKRVISYGQPVDVGLIDWAASYLNEALGGLSVGARLLHTRLVDASLSDAERDFVLTLAPAFTELEETAQDTLYVEGAARLVSEQRFQELSQIDDIMQLLERRVALLAILRGGVVEPRLYLRIGHENEAPELQSLSLVAANYGLATRNLGAVSVIGPVRMDYATAITSVRQAAADLSQIVGDLYDE